jgi:hypothetical protein
MNKLGRLVNGETVIEMLGPPNALMAEAASLSQCLYALSETIIRGLMPDERGSFLIGGDFGYACEFENEVFKLYPDYQDYREAPDFNFLHKRSGLKIRWYKWIGRDMEVDPETISNENLATAMRECFESIPAEVRERAQAEHDYEHTAEYYAAQREAQARLRNVLFNPVKYNAARPHVKCVKCGKEENLEPQWGQPLFWRCDACADEEYAGRGEGG